jgi:capsular polysaccharide transport system permease protein
MNENRHKKQPLSSLDAAAPKTVANSAADQQFDQDSRHAAAGEDLPARQEATPVIEQAIGVTPGEQGQADIASDAQRLVVVGDETEVVAAQNPLALQALRLARAAARDGGGPAAMQALRLARAAARDGGGPIAMQALRLARVAVRSPVQAKVVPAKAPPAELEAWPEFSSHAGALATMHRTRRRRFFGRLALAVGIPTILMALYLFLWATPRYVSEYEITYQTYQNTQSLSAGLVQSLIGGSQSGSDFGSILYEYIRSSELLHKLDAKMNLRKYYSSDRVDYPARLNPNVTDEAFLAYYHQHIVDVSEGLGGYLTIDVRAYDAEYAQALAKAMVEACDEMADRLTTRARQDSIKFAEEEVQRQEERVRQAQMAETRFQNEHRDLNPTNTATQFGQIVGSLETQLSQTKTALTNTLSYANASAPQVQQLKNQIAALESQLRDQRNRLTGGDKTYSQILEEYSRLQLEEQFAQNAYQSAQQGLAVARADAARKQSYLVDFIAPTHPDGPSRSFYTFYLGTAFFGSLFLYAIGSLLAGAFRDQAGL